MAISDSQYNAILRRLRALEEHANALAIAQDRFLSIDQLKDLITTFQEQIERLNDRVDALESELEMLINEPLT